MGGMLPGMRKYALLCVGLLVCLGVGLGQAPSATPRPAGQPATPVDAGTPDAADVAARNALLKPAMDALAKRDFAAAFAAVQPAIATRPTDPVVLNLAASAALGAKKNEDALALFQRSAAANTGNPWPARTGVMQALARLNRWGDFDKALAELRAAKKAGTDHSLDASNGFVIDEFETGRGTVDAVVFPLLAGRYHTLYRFLLPKESNLSAQAQASTTNNQSPQCQNPNFRPYIDIESDDVDQFEFKKSHPEKAAKGERSYSMDSYPSPCSQALHKFYPEGEPTYETVRADVIGTLSAAPKH